MFTISRDNRNNSMLKSVEARRYMTVKPVTLSPDTNIVTAINTLIDNKVSGATVVDAENNVVGVISEMDCLKAMLDGGYYDEVNGTVGDYMTTDIETISADATIIDVAQRLIEHKRRRLPIVENGKFVGQYSARSILQAIKEFK